MPDTTSRFGARLLSRGVGAWMTLIILGCASPCDPDAPCLSGVISLDEADLFLAGAQRDGQAGLAVALMGDINGDHFDDILVGAPGEGEGGQLFGAAHLIYGPTSGFLPLDEADAHFTGYVPRGTVGSSVSSPGDVNRDGFDDVLIGSGTANEAYLFYGPALGTLGCDDAPARFRGINGGDRAGAAVAGIGDVNGDGFPDVAVGASMVDGADLFDRGAVYIFYGGANLRGQFSVADAPVVLFGSQSEELAGSAVVGVGDVNGDSHNDILVGAPGFSRTSGSREGAAYLVHGPLTPGVYFLRDAATRFIGEVSGDAAGGQLSAAGDVDRDGIPDLLIGARKNSFSHELAGAAYLIYGSSVTSGDVSLASSSVRFVGEAQGDGAGFVSRGGDVNGDGYADVVIGASTHDSGGAQDSGAAYLIYGPVPLGTLDLSDADAKIVGVSAFDQAGYGVGGGGDVNGDTFHDIIVGAFLGDADTIGPNVGTAGVFFGGD